MQSSLNTTSLQPKQFAQKITLIWGAILASSFVLTGVAMFQLAADPESSRMFPSAETAIEIPLAGMAVLMFLVSFALPKFLLGRIPTYVALRNDPTSAETTIWTQYFLAKIIGFALAESCVLYGVALTASIRSDRIVLPFFALTLISLLANRPQTSEVTEISRKCGLGPQSFG